MTTATISLTDFLLARIAEDEAVAQAVLALQDHGEDRWWVDGPAEHSRKWWVYATGEKFNHEQTATHIARHDPARVLAECEARRRIVLHFDPYLVYADPPEADAWFALLTLALPYADHPDYREEWRP